MSEHYEGFCTECRFKIKSFYGLRKCPNCDTEGVPCLYSEQVKIDINWHELHILFVWAERYGRSIGRQGLIYGIAHSVEEQFPHLHQLTLMGAINQIKREHPGMQAFDENGNEIKE